MPLAQTLYPFPFVFHTLVFWKTSGDFPAYSKNIWRAVSFRPPLSEGCECTGNCGRSQGLLNNAGPWLSCIGCRDNPDVSQDHQVTRKYLTIFDTLVLAHLCLTHLCMLEIVWHHTTMPFPPANDYKIIMHKFPLMNAYVWCCIFFKGRPSWYCIHKHGNNHGSAHWRKWWNQYGASSAPSW